MITDEQQQRDKELSQSGVTQQHFTEDTGLSTWKDDPRNPYNWPPVSAHLLDFGERKLI